MDIFQMTINPLRWIRREKARVLLIDIKLTIVWLTRLFRLKKAIFRHSKITWKIWWIEVLTLFRREAELRVYFKSWSKTRKADRCILRGFHKWIKHSRMVMIIRIIILREQQDKLQCNNILIKLPFSKVEERSIQKVLRSQKYISLISQIFNH